jgi:hypothetical protein
VLLATAVSVENPSEEIIVRAPLLFSPLFSAFSCCLEECYKIYSPIRYILTFSKTIYAFQVTKVVECGEIASFRSSLFMV